MAGNSTYLQNAHLNWLKGTQMPTPPSALYVGLFSADPTDAGLTANEVTTTIRPAGRVTATFGAISGTNTSTMTNNAVVDFGSAAGGATVTYFGVFDAASGGNMLGSGSIAGGTVATANAVSFAAGALTWSES